MASMFSRIGKGWPLWVTLAVMWTLAVFTYGWMNLPRAQQLPHNPQFLSKLSHEAASILFGSDAQAQPARDALVWSQIPMVVRMPNGMRLKFPAPTTHEQAALVASEYHQLLDVEAGEQRGPYLLHMLAIWLAPFLLLVAGLAIKLVWRGYAPALGKMIPGGYSKSSIEKTAMSASATRKTGNRTDGDTLASSATHPVSLSY